MKRKKKKNFNSYCTRDGREFENRVILHEVEEFNSILISRDTLISNTGVEIDAVMEVPLADKSGSYSKTLTKYIQAKGGKPGAGKKPGAKRTDSVKKAIAEGTLLKQAMPDCWFTIYFSEEPANGSYSDMMIKTALAAGVVDEIKYLKYQG